MANYTDNVSIVNDHTGLKTQAIKSVANFWIQMILTHSYSQMTRTCVKLLHVTDAPPLLTHTHTHGNPTCTDTIGDMVHETLAVEQDFHAN